MGTINHCGVSRPELARHLHSAELQESVLIPQDGELIVLEVLAANGIEHQN
jgi:hypothetical protein